MSAHPAHPSLTVATLWPQLQQRLATVPLPLAGLTLGLASLAQAGSQIGLLPALVTNGLSVLAAAFWLLLLLKVLSAPRSYWQQLQEPLAGSVAPTAAMALLVLSQSVTQPSIRLTLWYLGIVLHLSLLLVFIRARCRQWQLTDMLPSWFVPPVGILVAVVSCPGPDQLRLAHGLLLFGAGAFVLLLPLMLYRLILLPTPPTAQQSSLAILAAPASLTLVAYLVFCQLTQNTPDLLLCIALYALALLLDLLVWLLLPSLLRQTFHAGFAALTFPLVISALASHKLALLAWSTAAGVSISQMAQCQLLLAATVTTYVAIRLLYRMTRQALSANIHLTDSAFSSLRPDPQSRQVIS